MNAWLPQASYPCGNFSDTSSFKFRRSKGSIGHAFTMCRPSQTPHLTMSSARIDPPKRVLGLKEGVVTPPPIHGVIGLESSSTGSSFPADSAKPVPLAVVSLDSRQGHRIPLVRTSSELAVRRPGKAPERAVPSLSPGRHEAVRSRHVSSSSSPPTVDGGCSPWRPDAVMSTTGRERHSVLRIFKGHRECTGHHATCGALPAAGPYLRLSRFQDVPPQPNSPPDNVLRPDRPAEASLGSKRRGCYPASDSRKSSSTGSSFPADSAKPVPLAVVSLDSRQGHSELAVRRPGKAPERAVPSPSPGRHEAVRSRHVSSSSSPPTVDGFGTGTPEPSPQSQSFSRSYGSILPTSLAYIVPSTRGCSPWRPDAVMSTTGRERHSVLRIFKGRRECTGHHVTCGALPAAGPYLRLSRFQGGQARPPRPPTHRGLALAPTAGYRSRASAPSTFGASRRPEHADAEARREARAADHDYGSDDASPAPIRFPPDNFKHSLTLFSKSFSSLPRGTCSLSVSRPYLALDGIYRPIGAAFPNNPTRRQRLVVRQGPGTTGLSPSLAPLSRELGPGPSLRTLLQTTI
ncbi:unnamed protein product [Brassica rapa subsp. narinosa]